MKPKFIILIVIFLTANFAVAQSVNFRFNNYFYTWQRIDSLTNNSDAKTTHLRGYQNYLLEFKSDKWSFNTLAQTEEDLTNKVGRGFGYRFYSLYIKGSNLFDLIDMKLGRQYIFAGTGKGAIDGLNLKIKAGENKEYQFSLYGGALTPYSYEFSDYPELSKNYHFGGQFTYYGVRDLTASLSYTNKKSTPDPYTAFRLDSAYNLVERTIELDGPSQQLMGLDLNYTYLRQHNFFGRFYFDAVQNQIYRAEVNARVSLPENFRVSAEYIFRNPYFSYNSIFWVFPHNKNQEISGGVDYTFENGINAFVKSGIVLYEDDNSVKLQAGFTHPNFGLSFVRYFGYAGESDGINGYYQRKIFDDRFSGSASVSYSRYRLGNIYDTEKVNSFSGMLGITYRPMPQLSFDLQGQLLSNRIYKTDTRLLVGFSYWAFEKF